MPEAPTSPAPAAPSPSPAPAAPATPSPSAPLAPNYTPPAPSGDRTFTPGKFDDLDTLGDAPTPAAPPSGPAPKPPEGAPPKPPEKAAAAPEPELDVDGVPKVKTNKELRQWAITQNKSAKEAQAKADRLEAKIKELESVTGKTPQTAELEKHLAKMNEQVQDYETRLRFANYQQSNEYKEKYEQPINSAIEKAHKFMEELRVEETNGETGEVTTRPATTQDFNRLYHLDRADARTLAKQMFGDDANEVLGYRAKVRELSEAAGEAIEKYRKEGRELETQRTIKSKQELEGTHQMWRDVNEDLGKKYPQWFKPVDGDDEGNKALEKGYSLVDSALGENRQKMTIQERIIADAHIRNRAAGFTRLAMVNKKLTTEIAELKKTIEKVRGSSPGGKPAAGGGEGAPKKNKTWEEDMDERFAQ